MTISSGSWAEIAGWRCDGQPWEQIGPHRAEHLLTMVCVCGRTSGEHQIERVGAPRVDPVTGAVLCPGFDPVARMRRVTYVEIQHARPDRLDRTGQDDG